MSYFQPGYGEVLDLHEAVGAPPVTFEQTSVFKWFDYVNASTKQRHRVSYDDAETLLVKYKALLQAEVAGVAGVQPGRFRGCPEHKLRFGAPWLCAIIYCKMASNDAATLPGP